MAVAQQPLASVLLGSCEDLSMLRKSVGSVIVVEEGNGSFPVVRGW